MTERKATSVRRPIATFRLTRRLALLWIVVAVVGFFAFAYAFGYALAMIEGRPFEPIVIGAGPPPDAIRWIVLALSLVVLVVPAHESLHGLCMARYGGSPTFGVGLSQFLFPYAYTDTEGASYTRTEMLAVLLAPFVGITAVGLVALVVYPSPILVVALAANAAGSIGDLWMAAALLRYPPTVRIADPPDGTGQGFAIYGASANSSEAVERRSSATVATVVAGAVGTFAVLAAGFLVCAFGSLAFGSGTVVVGTEEWLLFRHERQHDGSVHLEVGATLVLAVSAAGGVGWGLVRTVVDGAWKP